MTRPKVYLDTSVPSAYFDERAPDRQRLTQRFWVDRLPMFEAVVSEFVLQEIDDTPESTRRDEMRRLVEPLAVLDYDEEAKKLVQKYLHHGVFKEKTLVDAIHVAITVAHRIGYLASWNFKHLVNDAIGHGINQTSSMSGYGPIEIVAPSQLKEPTR